MFIQPAKNNGLYPTLEKIIDRIEKELGHREIPQDWISCLTGNYFTTAYNIQNRTNLEAWQIVGAFLNGWYRQVECLRRTDSICEDSMKLAIKGMCNEPCPIDDGTASEIADLMVGNYVKKFRAKCSSTEETKAFTESYWQTRIDEIMDNFDFGRVKQTMEHLKWSWCIRGGGYGVPTIKQLRDEARRQLEMAVKEGKWISSGGFQVIIEPEDGYLCLMFIVEEFDSYGENKDAN